MGVPCIYTGVVTIEMMVASCVVKRAFSPSPVTSSADVPYVHKSPKAGYDRW